jgi:hypothetical protein
MQKSWKQAVFYVAQNAFAHRRGDVGDGDVAGPDVGFRADAPDLDVVDALDPAPGSCDLFQGPSRLA